jgi:mevalonate kinase
MQRGSGKIILFGEHFVVHNSYAIAAAIDKYVEVEITEINDSKKAELDSIFNSEEVRKTGHLYKAGIKMLEHLDLKKQMKLSISSTINSSGLGASAAFCVAFAKALNEKFSLDMDMVKVNELAFEGEKAFHGNPSGIDNTTSMYGGIVLFWKESKLNYNKINPKEKLKLLVVDTGKKRNTDKLIANVTEFMNNNPEQFKEYIAEVNHLVDDAKDAMLVGDMKYLGELMLINQSLLEKIGVSTEDIKKIITLGINNGALGGKLTGAGGGGSVILLYDCDNVKDKIINKLKEEGYNSFSIEIL